MRLIATLLPAWISGRTPDGRPYEPAGSWGLYRSTIRDYMDRVILKTPLGTLRIHWILRADDDREHPHDHPFAFTSLIVRGGYLERLADGSEVHHRRWTLNRRQAADTHAIVQVEPRTTTLVISGPKVKPWGFLTPDGWIHHRAYSDYLARRRDRRAEAYRHLPGPGEA